MENSLFLGADFGTQGVRVGITDMKGSIISSAEVKYETKFPKPGHAVVNTDQCWLGFEKAMGRALNKKEVEREKIKAISVCATSSTTLPVNEKGEALSDALMWMDIRSKDKAAKINNTNHSVLKYCGDAVSPEWFIPKLLWIKEERPELYNDAYKIVELLDLINFRLTKKWVASKVNAVCKWNYISEEGFSDDYMTIIGLEDYKEKIITEVIPMGEKIGDLNKEFAKKFGLREIPVIQGGIDAHIGMIGMGVVKPGKMASIMGTSFVQLLFTESEDDVKGIWGPYKDAMVSGYTLLEAGQISSGSIIKWFERVFDRKGYEDFKEMQKLARKVPIGSDGLIALDFFQGNRTPYKDDHVKGAFYGLTLNHEKEHIYRAIMEAVAFGFKNIVINFEENGVEINEVIATGGVTQDKLWMEIISDVTGKEFTINENTNYGTIAGCAILGAVGSGLYSDLEEAVESMVHTKEKISPNLENTKKYEKVFQDYLTLYDGIEALRKE